MHVVFYSTSAEDHFRYRLPVARHLREAGYDVVFAGPGGEYADRVERDGFSYRRVSSSPIRRGVLYDVTAGLRLASIYRELRPDIVHHFTLHGLLSGALAARLGRIHWVVQSVPPLTYKARASRLLRRRGRALLRLALGRAEVTFAGEGDRRFSLSRDLVRPERTHVIASSAVDLAEYTVREEPPRTPVAALVGPLQDSSAVQAFVDAARRLRIEGIEARFALIGTTAARPALPRRLLHEAVEDGILEWWGCRRRVASVLAKVHAVCILETQPLRSPHLMLEAAACSRPLVAVDNPAARWLVRHDETGRLVSTPDADRLAEALEPLLRDGEHRRCMGRSLRRLVETEFAADAVARQTMAVYERLFEKGREV